MDQIFTSARGPITERGGSTVARWGWCLCDTSKQFVYGSNMATNAKL